MRITLNTIKYQDHIQTRKANNKNKAIGNSLLSNQKTYNNNLQTLPLGPSPYFISFAGTNDILKEYSLIINNDINIISQENSDNTFDNVLHNIYNENPELYKKVLDKKNLYRVISKDYTKFSNIVLNSLNEVRYSDKTYTEFWQNNAKIGSTKISELIKSITNNSDINDVIKNSNEETYSLIKDKLTQLWLENELETSNKKPKQKEYNFDYKIGEAYQLFDENSLNIIFSTKHSDESKINAFKFLNDYVLEKLKKENGENLSETYQRLYNINSAIKEKQSYESMDLLKNEIVDFYKLAKEGFDKNHMSKLLEIEYNKVMFIQENEKEIPDLKRITGYQNFNTEQKFFISYYFNNLSKFIQNDGAFKIAKDDFLRLIISDRNIETPEEIINSIFASVDNIQNNYYYDLDNYYMLLQNSEFNKDIKFPTRTTYNPNDNLSYENLYLQKLNKPQLMCLSTEEQRNFLRTLTEDEFLMLNDKIKEDWKQNELPFVMFKQVRKHSYNSSIAVNICNELKKVNENLSDIKIKMDSMICSFDKFMKLCPVIKTLEEEKKINVNSSNIISDIEREYAALPKSEQENFDKAIADYMPSIIEELQLKVDRQEDKDLLELLKTQCKNKNKNKNNSSFLNTLNAIIISRSICNVGNAGTAFISKLAASKNLATTVASSGIGAASAASLNASVGTNASAGSLIPPVDPTTAIIFAIVVSTAILAKGIKDVKNLEKNQRPLIYTLEYNT